MAKEQKWPGTTMVAGILILVASFWTVGELTLIAYGTLFRWFAFLAFAGNLVPYDASGLRLGMERLEWFLFNLLAVGPILLSAALWINFSFHGLEQWYDLSVADRKLSVKRHWIDTGELPGRPRDPSSGPRAGKNTDHDPLAYAISVGCFGYPVVTPPYR